MGFFGFGKKDDVLDLTENYKRKMEEAKMDSSMASDTGDNTNPSGMPETPEERKKRLARRIVDMAEKLEDLSNQIYHLQQRVEVLERKANIRME